MLLVPFCPNSTYTLRKMDIDHLCEVYLHFGRYDLSLNRQRSRSNLASAALESALIYVCLKNDNNHRVHVRRATKPTHRSPLTCTRCDSIELSWSDDGDENLEWLDDIPNTACRGAPAPEWQK